MKNLFAVKRLVKSNIITGELPGDKEAYIQFFKIGLPSIVELVLISLIGTIDTMMVSRVGTAAISAVGLTGTPRMLFLCVFFAFNVGLTAVVARRKGQERQEDANITLRNTLVIVFLASIAVTAVSAIFSREIMLMAGAKPDTIDDASIYFRIIMLATPLNVLSLSINAAQRGIGNTRITMYVNITANLVNVCFNYVLINGKFGFPALGVKGAAIASFIGIFAGSILSLAAVLKPYGYLRLDFHSSWKFNKEALGALIKVGGNAVLEQLGIRIGFMIFARLVADLGTDNFATHQICMQFLTITFSFGDGLAVAGTSLLGQNLGRKRADIAMLYGKLAQRISLIVSLVIIIFLIVFRYPLVSLYSEEAHIIEKAANLMFIVAIFQPFQTSAVVISGCLRGAGDTKFVALAMFVCISVVRPICSFLAIHVFGLGLYGAWFAMLVDMIARLVCVYVRFSSFKWAKIKV